MLDYCEKNSVEPEQIKPLITKSLKEKLEVNARELNFLPKVATITDMMNMDAFDAYKVYIALKSHFNSDYDFNKYHGKTSVSLDSFLKRSDRHSLVRWVESTKKIHKTFSYLILSIQKVGLVILMTKSIWIIEREVESLKYTYQNDLVDLLRKGKDIDDILNVKDGQHPLLLKQFFGKNVDIETMVILDSLFSYCKNWDRDIE